MLTGQMTPYLATKLLDHTLRNVPYTAPTTVYLGLFLSDPGGVDIPVEVTGGAYIRKAITFAPAVVGATKNSVVVQFNVATTDWGNVTHWGIHDAATNGNMLYYGEADSALNVISSIDVLIPVNRIQVELS